MPPSPPRVSKIRRIGHGNFSFRFGAEFVQVLSADLLLPSAHWSNTPGQRADTLISNRCRPGRGEHGRVLDRKEQLQILAGLAWLAAKVGNEIFLCAPF